MALTPVSFYDVEIVRQSDLGHWVRIDRRHVFIGTSVSLPGTTIHRPGDRGRLVLPSWFTDAWGLPTPAAE
jgi:hypothetical protein